MTHHPTITYTPDPVMSYFPTPPEIADELVYQSLTPGHGDGAAGCGVPQVRVLEPSAGEGHLARAIREYLPFAHITCVEPSPPRAAALRGQEALADEVVESTVEDYLTAVAFLALGGGWLPFDLVVCNPPFTLPGRSEAWAEHVLAIYNDPHLLRPGGTIAAIVPGVVATGSSKRVRAVRDLLGPAVYRFRDREVRFERGRVEPCERGLFPAAGAGINPVLMWIHKPFGLNPATGAAS